MFRGKPNRSIKRDEFFEELKKAFDYEVKRQQILNDPKLNDIIYSGEIAPYMMAELISTGVIDPSCYIAKKQDGPPDLREATKIITDGMFQPVTGKRIVSKAVDNSLRLSRETRGVLSEDTNIPHMKGETGYGLYEHKDRDLTIHQKVNRIINQLTKYNYELGRKESSSTMNDNEKNPMPEEKPLTVNFRGIDIHLNEEEAVKLMGDLAKEITKED